METPEDRIVQHLLDDIKSTSRQGYFGTDGTFCGFWGFVNVEKVKGKALYLYWAKDKSRIGMELK
jgi:hypothetical protein